MKMIRGAAKIAAGMVAGLLLAASAQAQNGKTEVLWLGQSAFRITTPGGKVIITDPWLINNPRTPAQYKNLEALGKVDLLLVTHAHGDHFADAPAIAKLNNIPMYAPGGLNQQVTTLGILPGAQAPRFDKGGKVTPLPGIKVTATRAEHSSILVWKDAAGKEHAHAAGEPMGYIIELENGFKIFHMGDTGVFADMKWIAEYYKPDLVLIPIGGNFTMDPADAAYATRELLKPKYAIPMHYGANPLGKGTPKEYMDALGNSATKVYPLNPGEKVEF